MREPTEFAWRVHATQETWTTKADTKASILLAFEGGLGIVATSAADDAPAARPTPCWPR